LEIEMTPNDIEILIHCHVSPSVHPRDNAPAVQQALRSLVTNGLIEQIDGGGYHTTPRGKAHIEQLCGLSWPVEAWVGADGKVIEI
jgi:predicted transcriptional regulator